VYGAGVFLAVVGGSLLVAPTAASAAKPTVQILTLGNGNLRSGDRTTLTFRVANPAGNQSPSVDIVVTGDGVSCDPRTPCDFTKGISAGSSDTFNVTLVADNLEPGKQKSGSVRITAAAGDDTGEDFRTITVRGPDAVQRISQLKGKVRDTFGAAVPGALVAYSDSQGHRGQTTSDGSGNFRFDSTDENPISPGRIEVGARKDGFGTITASVNGQAGKTANATLTLPAAAEATPSASASASATPTAEPTEEASTEVIPEGTPPVAAKQAANTSEDGGSSSLIFIIAGALLVAVGIGAIVLVFIRRKEKDADEDEDGLGAVPAAAPAPAPRYGDATRVASPTRVGGVPAPDATMAASGAIPPSLANAQTMLQRAVPADDEFPDPYGAPPRLTPPDAGYGARTETWNNPSAPSAPGTYGAAPYGTAPGQAGQRFEEPTGRYNPDAAYGAAAAPQQPGHGGAAYGSPSVGRGAVDDPYHAGGYPSSGGSTYGGGYEQQGGSYEQQGGNYEQQGGGYGGGIDHGGSGYGSAGGAYGGHGAGGSYGSAAPQGGGYDQPTTYGQPAPGYDQPTTYGQQPAGGYDARGGYEQPGYYGGDQEQQPGGGRYGDDPGQHGHRGYDDGGRQQGGGGQRRSLDWLDD
jgi:Carboxypeptidase regulatory-like domain